MSRRTLAELELLWKRLGRDLELGWAGPAGAFDDADLVTRTAYRGTSRTTDLGAVEEVAAARQLLVNRLKTRRGELAALGHPDYGSRHHELIGEPNTERTRNLVKLYVLEALNREPRIQKVLSCDVTTPERPRDVVRITLDLRLVDQPNPLNLVIPFDLAGGST
ncbi:MAG TPA: GPW/gp25 family protein [Acidimicrobiia bacterium]|jgi:phage baseplate assembly protein W